MLRNVFEDISRNYYEKSLKKVEFALETHYSIESVNRISQEDVVFILEIKTKQSSSAFLFISKYTYFADNNC